MSAMPGINQDGGVWYLRIDDPQHGIVNRYPVEVCKQAPRHFHSVIPAPALFGSLVRADVDVCPRSVDLLKIGNDARQLAGKVPG